MVSSVVVFHSDLARLRTTLASLSRQVDELIVVDVSPDGEARAASLPGVDVLDGAANLGYGWACNLGIASSRADVVLISNSDVEYADGTVDALARAAADGGLVAPLQTVRRDSRSPAHTAETLQMGISLGASLNRWWGLGRSRFLRHRDRLLSEPPELLHVPEGMTLSGASLAARRTTWDRIGGFDERFFLYQEDADLGVRCRRTGVPLVVATLAPVFHESGSARAGLSEQILLWSVESERVAWAVHHLPVPPLAGIQLVGMGARALRCLVLARRAEAGVWLRTARQVARPLASVRRRRSD